MHAAAIGDTSTETIGSTLILAFHRNVSSKNTRGTQWEWHRATPLSAQSKSSRGFFLCSASLLRFSPWAFLRSANAAAAAAAAIHSRSCSRLNDSRGSPSEQEQMEIWNQRAAMFGYAIAARERERGRREHPHVYAVIHMTATARNG